MRHVRVRATGASLAVVLLAGACGGQSQPSAHIEAADVRACLKQAGANWAQVPLSDFGGVVFGIDFGANSAQIYVEGSSAEVADERDSIRAAEEKVGNTGPAERVILVESGNVLLSWANDPTAEQRDVVRHCAGVA
jgi:hypothetical protein